jgi:hypothetical protein
MPEKPGYINGQHFPQRLSNFSVIQCLQILSQRQVIWEDLSNLITENILPSAIPDNVDLSVDFLSWGVGHLYALLLLDSKIKTYGSGSFGMDLTEETTDILAQIQGQIVKLCNTIH